MCGRYAASAHPDELVEFYEVEVDATDERSGSVLKSPQDPPAGEPDYNMAPSKQAPIVLTRVPRGEGDGIPVRQLRLLTWGLVPSWAKGPSVGARMTNARVETVLEKPAYAKAAAARRCLVPITGWYEWQASPVATTRAGKPRKQPFFITRSDGAPLALAGLYEFWKDPAAPTEDPLSWIVSYTVLTRAAEPGLDRIHDRQPLVLEPDAWTDWLDPGLTSSDRVQDLLGAATDHGPGRFEAWPIGQAVGSTRNNGPQLLEPVPTEELEGVVDPVTGEVIGG
ncbi:SOS response-associated peptidase [Ornithinimicrobium pratense]|uniref:Abasic site processing protein n=1 Tax=Ornithinimicrobium pratense TaxID=2593973 RepID=A0A5J6V7R5_9MICO|nr:SOS response-associated peptidase [Ornithinimicrobium pratense]QFG69156.1 SOS response-associated peptidase [Ornithinimicrobium pratense]